MKGNGVFRPALPPKLTVATGGAHHVAADQPTVIGEIAVDLGDGIELCFDIAVHVDGAATRVGIGNPLEAVEAFAWIARGQRPDRRR